MRAPSGEVTGQVVGETTVKVEKVKEDEDEGVEKMLTSVFHVSITGNDSCTLFETFSMAARVFIENSSVTASTTTLPKVCFSHSTKKISHTKSNNLCLSNNKTAEDFCDDLAASDHEVESTEVEPNLNDNVMEV